MKLKILLLLFFLVPMLSLAQSTGCLSLKAGSFTTNDSMYRVC